MTMLRQRHSSISLTAVFVLGAAAVLLWPRPADKKLTYEQVYLNQGPRLTTFVLPPVGWLDDSRYIQRERDGRSTTLFTVEAATGKKTVLLDYGEIQGDFPEGLSAASHVGQTPDYSLLLYSFKDDLYGYSVDTGRLKRLTSGPESERNPTLSPDGRSVAFTRDNDLYVVRVSDGQEQRLTSDGSELILNGRASYVYYEEILFRQSRYKAFWWAPDSRQIAFLRFDDGPVPEFHITSAAGTHGHLETQRYPKPGDPNPRVRVGMCRIPEGRVIWADFDEDADHYLAWPAWLPDSSRLTVQWMNRGQDHIKVFAVDPGTGRKRELYEERQGTWVEFFDDIRFLQDGRGFLLRTDKDGRSHLYLHGMDGGMKRQLTSGGMIVREVLLVDEKNGRIYFDGKDTRTTESHLFRIDMDGSDLRKLTREPGTHNTGVSPGGSYFYDLFSSIHTPTRLDLHRGDGSFVRRLNDSRTPRLDEVALGKAELFTIPTSDGWDLPALWILPPDFDPKKEYPVLFSIYGGPGGLSVDWGWPATVSNSFPRLSSFFLAQEGMIFISVDHRGSGHFGKEGMAAMHRRLGHWEMHDLIEAVKWLRTKPFIDSRRIGITGGSYGGYVTCMALTYGAGTFTHGLARSSVTDWSLYDSVYTEKYMDQPQENPEGYAAGSVLAHAANLEGILFLEHGEADDNVHMQNTVQLIAKLMENDKDFGFMILPGQRHGSQGKTREFSSRNAYRFWREHLLGR